MSSALPHYQPITGWLPRYRRRLIAGDVLAGLVVAALAVPQSLGYAGIAGVPVIVGLYAQAVPWPTESEPDEDADQPAEPTEERIVVDHDVSVPTPEAIDEIAPRGGYQDPERLGRRSKSRYPRS